MPIIMIEICFKSISLYLGENARKESYNRQEKRAENQKSGKAVLSSAMPPL